jgi:hypothetical protein
VGWSPASKEWNIMKLELENGTPCREGRGDSRQVYKKVVGSRILNKRAVLLIIKSGFYPVG